MPRSSVTAQKDYVIRVFLRKLPQKGVHTGGIAERHYQEKRFSGQRFYSAVSIATLSYMMTGHQGTNILFAPAIFWLIDPSKTCFILEHELHGTACGNLEQAYFFVNFFEVSMTSSLAFFGSPAGLSSIMKICIICLFCSEKN